MAEFVFLEITDRDLNYLFSGITEVITGQRPKTTAHLTLRGPYSGKVPRKTLQKCREILHHQVLLLEGVGIWHNPREHVVFLGVNNPALRRTWWKPDFPIKDYGFTPHLSLYRGTDSVLASKIETFFRREGMSLNCAEFRVSTHVTKQQMIFKKKVPRALVDTGRVRENILDRLQVVVRRHRQSTHSLPHQGSLPFL